ncbi:MAG: BatA domain-containing protein, partial [Planctomycetales bacterium]
MTMGFEYPYFLCAGVSAVIILALYLSHIRGKSEKVATLGLWKKVLRRRHWWIRWQLWASLAVQLVILALLTVAAAGPYLLTGEYQPRTLVLIFDVSASMKATDVESKPGFEGELTRLQACLIEAEGFIASMRVEDETAILAAGGGIRAVSGL